MAKMMLKQGDKPSLQAAARMAALRGRQPDTSDIPEASQDELKEIARLAREKRKKKMFSLRLTADAIRWWQELGEGYTGVMALLLEEAAFHPEWIRQCLASEGRVRKFSRII